MHNHDDDFEPEDLGVSRPMAEPFSAIADTRLSRRAALMGAAAAGALAAVPAVAQTRTGSSLTFKDAPSTYDDKDRVSEGYRRQVVVRWGDPPTMPMHRRSIRSARQGATQEQQFGYNNDFMAFMPLPLGSKNSSHGLLCVNHEYCNSNLMFPGVPGRGNLTKAQTEVEMAAHGLSVVEIRKENGAWKVVQGR